MSLENHYNKIYLEKENVFNGGEAESIVQDILKYKTLGSVFELGAGQGRNSLYLAKNGFEVTARDISKIGIDKLLQEANNLEFSIKGEVGDARQLSLEKDFDIFVSTYMLHHLSREQALELIAQMKEHTKPEGLNAVTVFTKNGDFYRNNPETENFYPDKNELKNLYTDWEILEYQEFDSTAYEKKLDGDSMMNIAAKLLARRKN